MGVFFNEPSLTNDLIILKFGMGHPNIRAKGPQASEAPGGQRTPALRRS